MKRFLTTEDWCQALQKSAAPFKDEKLIIYGAFPGSGCTTLEFACGAELKEKRVAALQKQVDAYLNKLYAVSTPPRVLQGIEKDTKEALSVISRKWRHPIFTMQCFTDLFSRMTFYMVTGVLHDHPSIQFCERPFESRNKDIRKFMVDVLKMQNVLQNDAKQSVGGMTFFPSVSCNPTGTLFPIWYDVGEEISKCLSFASETVICEQKKSTTKKDREKERESEIIVA